MVRNDPIDDKLSLFRQQVRLAHDVLGGGGRGEGKLSYMYIGYIIVCCLMGWDFLLRNLKGFHESKIEKQISANCFNMGWRF